MYVRIVIFSLICVIFPINSSRLIKSVDFEFKISAIHNLIKNEGWNCTDVIEYFLERSIRYNPILNAITNYNPDALKEAIRLNDYYKNEKKFIGILHCIPVLVKDNIDVKGIPTTGGIKALRYSIPNEDATVIRRIKLEGGIVIAKANLAELAGENYDSEVGGSCKNPWDLNRSCGPSSTGIGAGISASLALIGIGTDTGGSIMNPSAFCGLFGLRPPHGLLEIDGIIPTFEKQDTVGPVTKYMDDLVLAYSVMANESELYNQYNQVAFNNLKVGLLKMFWNHFNFSNMMGNFTYKFDDEISKAIDRAKLNLKNLNINPKEIEFNEDEFNELNQISFEIVLTGLYNCIDSCFKFEIEKYFNDKNRFQSDSPYKNYETLLSSPLLSSYWKERFNRSNFENPKELCENECKFHFSLRKKFTESVESWFSKSDVDIILIPTNPDLAYLLDSNEVSNNISPTFIAPFSGFGTLSFPIAFSKPTKTAPDGLPIALMVLTSKQNILKAFKLANLYEENFFKNKILPKTTPKLNYVPKTCNNSRNPANINIILIISIFIYFICPEFHMKLI